MTSLVSMAQRRLLALPFLCFCLLGLASLLYVFMPTLYRQVLSIFIVNPFKTPFFDLEYVFTTASCWQSGVDVYVIDPCDRLNRLVAGSPLLLRVPFLALDRAWSMPFGLVLAVMFCISLYRLPMGLAGSKMAILGLAAVSPVCVFVVERGNVDLIVYLVALLAGEAVLYGWRARAGSYVGIFAAGLLLKFYPLAGLLLVTRERLRICIGIAFASFAALIVFFLRFRDELHRMAHNIPKSSAFGDMVGAIQLPAGLNVALGTLLMPIAGGGLANTLAETQIVSFLALVLAVAGASAVAASLMLSPSIRGRVAEIPPRLSAWLLLGSALMTGCFFAGQSVSYRCVHFLLVLPGLLWLQREGTLRRLRVLSRITVGAILLEMYRLAVIGVFARQSLYPGNSAPAAASWMCFELLWWWIVGALLGCIGCLLIESRSARDIGDWLRRHAGAH